MSAEMVSTNSQSYPVVVSIMSTCSLAIPGRDNERVSLKGYNTNCACAELNYLEGKDRHGLAIKLILNRHKSAIEISCYAIF